MNFYNEFSCPDPDRRKRPTWCGEADTTPVGGLWDAKKEYYCKPNTLCEYKLPKGFDCMTLEQQVNALRQEFEKIGDDVCEYGGRLDKYYQSLVNTAVGNAAYYREVTVEEGYMEEIGTPYKVVHIPFLDCADKPIYIELGLAYNNTTNSGVTEEAFDASQRFIADKMIPAMNKSNGWEGATVWKGAPINDDPAFSGFTVGITERGFVKVYENLKSYDILKQDNVRNAINASAILVTGGKVSTDTLGVNKAEQVSRVGIGMNYDTKERFIVVTGGTCTAEMLANVFVKYGATVAAETATGYDAYGMDKGKFMFMPQSAEAENAKSVPVSNAFWYITKRRKYHNDYVKDVALLTQRIGECEWRNSIANFAVDDVKEVVAGFNQRLLDEIAERATEDANIRKEFAAEDLVERNERKAEDANIRKEFAAADLAEKNERKAEDEKLKTHIDNVDAFTQVLEDEDIESVELMQEDTKDIYRLKRKDGTYVDTAIQLYNYDLLVSRLITLGEVAKNLEAEAEARKAADDGLSQRITELDGTVGTTTIEIGKKVNKSGDTLTGALKYASEPLQADELVNKQYVDRQVQTGGGNFLPLIGGQMSGNIDMGSSKIIQRLLPTDNNDVANKQYVDNKHKEVDYNQGIELTPETTIGAVIDNMFLPHYMDIVVDDVSRRAVYNIIGYDKKGADNYVVFAYCYHVADGVSKLRFIEQIEGANTDTFMGVTHSPLYSAEAVNDKYRITGVEAGIRESDAVNGSQIVGKLFMNDSTVGDLGSYLTGTNVKQFSYTYSGEQGTGVKWCYVVTFSDDGTNTKVLGITCDNNIDDGVINKFVINANHSAKLVDSLVESRIQETEAVTVSYSFETSAVNAITQDKPIFDASGNMYVMTKTLTEGGVVTKLNVVKITPVTATGNSGMYTYSITKESGLDLTKSLKALGEDTVNNVIEDTAVEIGDIVIKNEGTGDDSVVTLNVLNTKLGAYLSKAGGTMTGVLDMGTQPIEVQTVQSSDSEMTVNSNNHKLTLTTSVDNQAGIRMELNPSGEITLFDPTETENVVAIKNVKSPTDANDAASKAYVDKAISDFKSLFSGGVTGQVLSYTDSGYVWIDLSAVTESTKILVRKTDGTLIFHTQANFPDGAMILTKGSDLDYDFLWKHSEGVLVRTVTFDSNGGLLNNNVALTKLDIEITIPFTIAQEQLPIAVKVKDNLYDYSFERWNTQPDGNGKNWSANEVWADGTVLYAIYIAKRRVFKITWNANGGTPATRTTQVQAGSTVVLPSNPTRAGTSTQTFSFKGWFTAASGGSQVTGSTVPTGNTTYYAQWTVKDIYYTITFNANGGTPATQTKSLKAQSNMQLPTNPTRANSGDYSYSFKGWFTAGSGGSQVGTSTKVTGNVTYYAQWNQNLLPSVSNAITYYNKFNAAVGLYIGIHNVSGAEQGAKLEKVDRKNNTVVLTFSNKASYRFCISELVLPLYAQLFNFDRIVANYINPQTNIYNSVVWDRKLINGLGYYGYNVTNEKWRRIHFYELGYGSQSNPYMKELINFTLTIYF